MTIALPRFLASGLAVLALSANAATHEASIAVDFPDEVAGLAFAGRTEFPRKELGVNIGYQRSGLARGSVYIYNGGVKTIPTGAEAPAVRQHFAEVIQEVQQLQAAGKARISLHGSAAQTTTYAGCGPQFLWRGYDMELEDGTALTSYTYLTGLKNQYVKLRVSHQRGDDQGAKAAERFVQEIRKVVGGCR
ncbi:hypothetical protein ACS5PN_30280 [Roseateles sp. NT4]|uniref:hypothetical protein n=1 Tax=Roseateles sp. NT4 TaxID=3453715 RepID=UPI003EEA10BE